MSSYRLCPQAEESLKNIIGWTIECFGNKHAAKYKELNYCTLNARTGPTFMCRATKPHQLELAERRTAHKPEMSP